MHGRAHRPHIAQIFKDAVAQPLQRLHTVAVLQRRLGWYLRASSQHLAGLQWVKEKTGQGHSPWRLAASLLI
eukprot:86328-Pelagomonas_calceolata.AAC.5